MVVSFEIIVNPSGNDDWKKCVDQAYSTHEWRMSYNDYAEYLQIFNAETFQFYVAKETTRGEIIGFVIFGVFPDFLAQLEFYYVWPEYRGQGVGMALFQRAIEKHHRIGMNIAIFAATPMSAKYAKSGFDKIPEWQFFSIQADVADFRLNSSTQQGYDICAWTEVSMDQIVHFDSNILCGLIRRHYLERQLKRPDMFTKIAFDNQKQTVIAMCSLKVIIGNRLLVCPLYAQNEAIARQLLLVTLQSVPNLDTYTLVQSYVPSCNQKSIDLLADLSQGRSRRGKVNIQLQFTQEILQPSLDHVFCINAFGLTFI